MTILVSVAVVRIKVYTKAAVI